MTGQGHGRVEAIHIGPNRERPMERVDEVRAEAGRGLIGDRYHDRSGTYSRYGSDAGRHVTLIAAEDVEAMVAETGIPLDPGETRRNVVTRGVDLRALIGRRFRIGSVVCYGVKACDPCSHLESLTRPGVLRGLVNRGGLRADVVVGGTIATGQRIEVES